MKRIKGFAFAFLAISLTMMSCAKDDEDTPDDPADETKTTFTFDVSDNYIAENDTSVDNRAWVLIYSQNNDLLFEQEVENGKKYEYELTDKGAVNVQLFRARFSNGYYNRNLYGLNVYTNVTPDDWKLGGSSDSDKEPIGHASVDLVDIDFYSYYYPTLKSTHADGYYDSESGNVFEVPLYYTPDAIWLCLQPETGAPLYKWVPDVSVNDALSIGAGELEAMTGLNVELPANNHCSVYVEGNDLSSDDPLWSECYYKSFSNGETSVEVYYPTGVFNDFWTYYRASSADSYDVYARTGPSISEKLLTLDVDATITNSNVLDFKATTTGAADRCQVNWSAGDYYTNSFNYYVYGEVKSSFTYKAPPIPQDIMDFDEDLIDLNKLDGGASIYFADYSVINGYQDYIKAYRVEQRNVNISGSDYKGKTCYSNKSAIPVIDDKEMIKQIKQELFK